VIHTKSRGQKNPIMGDVTVATCHCGHKPQKRKDLTEKSAAETIVTDPCIETPAKPYFSFAGAT
jgi:hypothetical protein